MTNLANYVAGVCSNLDEKVALTNQSLDVTQMPGLYYTPAQLDALTQAKINVLRYKGAGNQPALLHDMTQASSASDYTTVLRMRIKGLVVSTLLATGDPFIGSSSLGGLQLTSLKTALDSALSELSQRGYISNPSVTITTTRSLRPAAPKDPRARARRRAQAILAPARAGSAGDTFGGAADAPAAMLSDLLPGACARSRNPGPSPLGGPGTSGALRTLLQLIRPVRIADCVTVIFSFCPARGSLPCYALGRFISPLPGTGSTLLFSLPPPPSRPQGLPGRGSRLCDTPQHDCATGVHALLPAGPKRPCAV